MSWQPTDPRAPPSKMDQLVMGVDCTRHGLLGCLIGYGNGDPRVQARDFLYSEYAADRMTGDEYQTWTARLQSWEAAGNTVVMPPQERSADHPERRPRLERVPTPPSPEQIAQTAAIIARNKANQQAAADAVALNAGAGGFLDGVKAAEQAGLRPAGSYDGFVADLWSRKPKVAEALKLPKSTKH